MTYNIIDIVAILRAQPMQMHNAQARVEQLLLDSRQIIAPATALFFALPGKRHDGHAFINDLYRAGVRQFVVSQAVPLQGLPEANVMLVKDTLAALQTLAAHHRQQFAFPVIGVTGSNGKTIVKEWLAQLLRHEFDLVRSPKSYNSQIGVPLSVWQMQPQHTLGIFEAGISQPGEMEHLGAIIRPTIGIFTNIGSAHREGFASKTLKIAEKMRLFDATKMLIFCADHEKIAAAAAAWQNAVPGRTLFSWSKEGRHCDLQITEIQPEKTQSSRISASFKGEKWQISIPFSDTASIENAIHCWALLLALPLQNAAETLLTPAKIRARMRRLEPVEMRLELKSGINRCRIINDSYNNDLVSLRIALNFAAAQSGQGPMVLVLSDILQSGQEAGKLYDKVASAILEKNCTRVIGIGTEIPALREKLPADFPVTFFTDTDAFLQDIQNQEFADELILLKGARPFAFERIARRLEAKAHKTVLEVNLSALVHNLNVYTRLLQPGTKILVMVKAAAYGSGSIEVAKLLEFHKVDYLGVAYADEGIELRQAGINLPILVLNPEASSFDALYRFRLEPEIYSLPELDDLLHYVGKEKRMGIHLKLDTGMHRLGFEPQHLPELLEKLQKHPNLHVNSVFSHLAASDSPVHDDFTRHQGDTFSQMFAQISAALGYAPLRHIVNTGGIARFPQYHFDMVRLGIGLYGIDSSGLQEQLQIVNTLKATISQIKEIMPGDSVGYNRNARIERPTRTATISIGYADGFLRMAGLGRYSVLIHGQKAPTVGNICMDMTMVDVTHIPQAREGDEVLVFGAALPVQALADCLQTIPYEVFTSISGRVNRVYWAE